MRLGGLVRQVVRCIFRMSIMRFAIGGKDLWPSYD